MPDGDRPGGAGPPAADVGAAADPRARSALAHRRLVALDVGSKTIGVAVREPGGVVSPQRTLRRKSVVLDAAALQPLAAGSTVVVGLPSYDDGGQSASTRRARQIGEALAAAGCVVVYQDERYTTAEAEDRLRHAGVPRARWPDLVDAWAAAVILEDWLRGDG